MQFLRPIEEKFYNPAAVNADALLFQRKDIQALLIPLMLEQLLNSLMGMFDTVMVTSVGSAAVSAVSLVDSVNNLIIQIFSALAAGGVIICSQYLGRNERENAIESARQLVLVVAFLSASISVLCAVFNRPLLRLIFGSVEDDVMAGSVIYFGITLISFPVFSLFSCGSAFFRAGGNSRFPMIISVIGNAMNIAGNAVLIFVFDMGIAGAALSTLASRIFCFIAVFIALRNDRNAIYIRRYRTRPHWGTIKRILTISVPSGLENGMFQFGKLAIQSTVSTLPTYAIAAQALTVIFENVNGVAGIGVGLGLMTIVGQTLGAGRREEAKFYIVKLTELSYLVILLSCLAVLAISKPVMLLSGLEERSADLCFSMLCFITIVKPLVWPPSFTIPYGLRAAGDVRYSMLLSSLSMWIFRVATVVILIRGLHMGPLAVWIGMAVDWCVRAVFFVIRFHGGKWLKHEVI